MLRFHVHTSQLTNPVGGATDVAVTSKVVEVMLVLRPRNPLPGIADLPSTPLSHDDLESRYGAREDDILRVQAFADKNGLAVKSESSQVDRATITLSGTLPAIDKAFGSSLNYAKSASPNSKVLFAPRAPVAIPDPLQGIVEHIVGLDNRPIVLPMAATTDQDLRRYYAPQVAALYNYPALAGQGQCVGIIAIAGGYLQEDIKKYFDGLPDPLPVPTIVNEGPNVPLPGYTTINMEVTMDLQIIGSICPKATIVVYNAGSDDFSLHDYFKVLCKAIFDRKNRPSVLSNSLGWPMIEGFGLTPGLVHAFENLFCKAALLGITICSSSGDNGSFFPAIVFPSSADAGAYLAATYPTTQYPASSAFVLSCGGTTLVANKDRSAIESEVVWNRLADGMIIPGFSDSPGTGMASGGGVARGIDLPYYQESASVPLATTTLWDNGELTKQKPFRGRGIPDVAANADFFTGYSFVFEKNWVTGGGTSAAAPMWAALVTLINQALGKRVGFLNPILYELQISKHAKVFRPIVSGGNGGYSASADKPWNPCTGLGSPDATKLLQALQATL